jgi:hypothetical protein
MAKKKADYMNTRHGLLKVISCVEPSNGHNNGGSWLCMCKCKRMITVAGYRLHSRKSCGCLGRKAAKERGKALRKSNKEKYQNARYRQYKRMNKEIPLTKEDWLTVAVMKCQFCGNTEEELCNVEWEDIDLVISCNDCRSMKGKLSVKDFTGHIKQVYKHLSDT